MRDEPSDEVTAYTAGSSLIFACHWNSQSRSGELDWPFRMHSRLSKEPLYDTIRCYRSIAVYNSTKSLSGSDLLLYDTLLHDRSVQSAARGVSNSTLLTVPNTQLVSISNPATTSLLHQVHLLHISIIKLPWGRLSYPCSFCLTISPSLPVCFPDFPPSTTNLSSW
jgi:hypothetical protein